MVTWYNIGCAYYLYITSHRQHSHFTFLVWMKGTLYYFSVPWKKLMGQCQYACWWILCSCTYVFVQTCTSMHARVHTHTYTHAHTHIHTHIHMHTHTHTHIHLHSYCIQPVSHLTLTWDHPLIFHQGSSCRICLHIHLALDHRGYNHTTGMCSWTVFPKLMVPFRPCHKPR